MKEKEETEELQCQSSLTQAPGCSRHSLLHTGGTPIFLECCSQQLLLYLVGYLLGRSTALHCKGNKFCSQWIYWQNLPGFLRKESAFSFWNNSPDTRAAFLPCAFGCLPFPLNPHSTFSHNLSLMRLPGSLQAVHSYFINPSSLMNPLFCQYLGKVTERSKWKVFIFPSGIVSPAAGFCVQHLPRQRIPLPLKEAQNQDRQAWFTPRDTCYYSASPRTSRFNFEEQLSLTPNQSC